MARLDTLPIELLHIIAEYTSADPLEVADNSDDDSDAWLYPGPERGRTPLETDISTIPWEGALCDLAALALTTRFFNRLFEPLLYQWDMYGDERPQAVHWAIKHQSLGTLKRAQAAGLDFGSITSLFKHWGSPLQQALLYSDDHTLTILKWLLENGVDPNPCCSARKIEGVPYPASDASKSALCRAIEGHHEKAALLLLDHGAAIFFTGRQEDPDDRIVIDTALHKAAKSGCVRVVERLLKDGPLRVDDLNSNGHTPLMCAAGTWSSRVKITRLLLQHGANPLSRPEGVHSALSMAMQCFHVRNVFTLLQHARQDPSNTEMFSHASLWELLSMLNWRLVRSPGHGSHQGFSQVTAILSVFVKLGADFNNPPPPYASEQQDFPSDEHRNLSTFHHFCLFIQPMVIRKFAHAHLRESLLAMFSRRYDISVAKALLDIGAVDPLTKMHQDRTVFDELWNEYLEHNDWEKEVLITSFLRAGARVDVKNLVTGQTALESAVAACNHSDEDQGITLQFLLKQTTACSLARSHIYDVLDSQLTTIWKYIDTFILIMQHGWVSKRARAYAFDWLVSYLTGSPSKDGIYLDLHDSEFNAKATHLFPQFLDRQQLRELWEIGLSGLSIKRGRAIWARSDERFRWRTLPWWDTHARSDNVKGIEMLFDLDFGKLKQLAFGGGRNGRYEEDDQAVIFIKANNGALTPLMVAISAGNSDAAQALIMIESQQCTIKSETFACDHLEMSYYDTCRNCHNSQRSAYEIAMLRGDVELLELMWKYQPKEKAWENWLEDMPRVLSYGNVMVEWIHMNLCLNTMRLFKMSGEGASLRTKAKKKLLQLRTEIIETQVAWTDRAKSLGRQAEAPKSMPFPTIYNLSVRR